MMAAASLTVAGCAVSDVETSSETYASATPMRSVETINSPIPYRQVGDFHKLTAELILALNPACPLTTAAGNDLVMQPSRLELQRFRQSLDRWPLADHFDYADEQAQAIIASQSKDCATPDHVALAELREKHLSQTQRLVEVLQKKADHIVTEVAANTQN